MARRVDPSTVDADCYTVPEFCARNRISTWLYYELRKVGLGPDEIHIGDKVLISKEAAARWRAAREAEPTSLPPKDRGGHADLTRS